MNMNDQETEVKYYVKQHNQVEARLRELGARLIQPRVFERNLRFDLPDGSLRREKKILRLRQDTQARLTYKGPSQPTEGVLSRAEYEITVDDFDTALAFLEALGYLPVATYEKYRRTYELRDLHIMLDELPYGDFVEIEGPDVAALQKASADLGLDFSAAIPANYLVLFESLCKRREGLDPTQLTFGALEGMRIEPREISVRSADR
jgi:adenylate cyclase class 2